MIANQLNFLQDDGARGIILALQAAGEECRAVGGCVRDALAGHAVKDIDLATTALPEKTMAVLSLAGFQTIPVGVAHGVVMAVRDGRKYEIATLREDVQTDGRHAVVAFTRDWGLDARRRDFTINAMSVDITGQVYDYLGGQDDLAAGRVQFIGDAMQRIREDYLRILRFYRFHAVFGKDDGTAARAACRELRSGISQLSHERITEELIKLLSLPDPLSACRAMTDDQILLGVLPQLDDISALETLLQREAQYQMQLPWYVRFLAWHQGKMIGDTLILTRMARAEMKLLHDMDISDLRPALHHHGKDHVMHAVLLRADDAALQTAIQQIRAFVPKEFPMAAEDILQLGVAPGPRLGEILRKTEVWWLSGDCQANREECKAYAETLATDSKA